ncbi:MAG: sigma 54-interacting transcriptional regulator [Actinobacteria bacterium]|nr:sigma 54-interacting transcriptional regulator [Actinomycetota bacterium]
MGAPLGARASSRKSGQQLRALHERFIDDPEATDLSSLRPVIARSWIRSIAFKVDPGMTVFDEIREPHLDEQVLRCADPVLDELERMSADTGAGITLTDSRGTLAVFRGEPSVRRWAEKYYPTTGAAMAEGDAGTNGDGTALEEGHGIQVWGPEHFVEGLQETCCTTAPIRDPMRRSVRALLSLSLPWKAVEDVDPRSVALVTEGAAAEVTRLLAGHLAMREQALLSTYLSEVRKRGAGMVVVMDDRTTIASKGAMQVLEQSDYAVLAGYARESEKRTTPIEREITVGADSTLRVQASPISEAGDMIGSLIRLKPAKPAPATRRQTESGRNDNFQAMVGKSPALRRALEVATTVARRRIPAYISGDRGTGKAMLAAAIAANLADEAKTFDCSGANFSAKAEDGVEAVTAALRDGKAVVLVHADRASSPAKEALIERLAVFDDPPVILTTSTLDDETLDLTTVLGAVAIEMPRLNSRREDVPLLVSHFLATGKHGVARVTPALMRALTEVDWTGNVGQLREFIDTAAARCSFSELGMEHLSEAHGRVLARNPLSRLEEVELQQIREALAEAGGNRVRAAELLQIGRSTLYRKIDAYTCAGFSLEI